LEKLFDDCKNLSKNKNRTRAKQAAFVDNLDNLFDIAHANAMDAHKKQRIFTKKYSTSKHYPTGLKLYKFKFYTKTNNLRP